MTTVFSKIIQRELPAEIVYENERIIAINDIHPEAPVHILIIPKREIPGLKDITEEDIPLLGEIMWVAKQLAEEYHIADGYRLLTNNGPAAGQAVYHLHFHLLGGRKLGAIG